MTDELTPIQMIAGDLPQIQQWAVGALSPHLVHVQQARVIVQMADALQQIVNWTGGAIQVASQPVSEPETVPAIPENAADPEKPLDLVAAKNGKSG